MEKFSHKVGKAVEIIKKGGVIAAPTDTVFGLLANAKDRKAVKRVFKIKKRSFTKPIPLFVKSIEQAKNYAIINKEQKDFLKEKWPGRTTVVFKAKKNKLPDILFKKSNTIGLRIPDSDLIKKLFKNLNFPLTATSANISGENPARTKKQAKKHFQEEEHKPDLILKGSCFKTKPSTVIDYTSSKIKIIRN
ncbi:MAG: L-threonylcarbamoyladenylate synthase [Minisyncoccales bacterium]